MPFVVGFGSAVRALAGAVGLTVVPPKAKDDGGVGRESRDGALGAVVVDAGADPKRVVGAPFKPVFGCGFFDGFSFSISSRYRL